MENNYIKIHKKVLWAIAPAAGIISVLLAQNKGGPTVLFILGIITGIFIGKFIKESSNENE